MLELCWEIRALSTLQGSRKPESCAPPSWAWRTQQLNRGWTGSILFPVRKTAVSLTRGLLFSTQAFLGLEPHAKQIEHFSVTWVYWVDVEDKLTIFLFFLFILSHFLLRRVFHRPKTLATLASYRMVSSSWGDLRAWLALCSVEWKFHGMLSYNIQ